MRYERTRIKKAIVSRLKEDRDIIGIYLGGSLAKGTEDAFSDIDLRIVIEEGASKQDKLTELIEDRKDVLFIESWFPSFAVIHFDCFVKLDLFVYYQSQLDADIWLKEIKILKDTKGILEKLKNDSEKLTYLPTQEEFEAIVYKYLAHFHELYRRYQRKEYHYVQQSFLSMQHCLVSLYHIHLGIPANSPDDWSKYEGERSLLTPDKQVYLLKLSQTTYDQITSTLDSLNKVMERVAKEIAETNHLNFKQDLFSKATELVDF
ncbi:aminoglycoside 6-adenylyltransferase [Marinilactibacillus sp. Marseille-P9653]|uniref:nucleotidyltransferase domain-containing protein n=1 Tax=Marinilactibacillus sp. Marseille-P9653 TaxID=2866583 RepID=UPI001CE3BF0D|nr:nucleotidyltransferase domain-containing protein [Marinilactibacillus sp. Marseille-P9653]